MRKILVFLVACQCFLTGCNNNQKSVKNYVITTSKPVPRVENLPQVVATTSILCDLTKQIAAKTVNLICIIPGDTNPRIYKPTPENSQVVRSAQLILYHGYNLETNLISLIKSSQTSGLKVAVGEVAVPKPLFSQQGQKKIVNPYLWHDPKNVVKITDILSQNLIKIAPKNTELYRKNHQKMRSELTQLDNWIRARINSIPPNQKTLISNSGNLSYYTKTYKINYQPILTKIKKQDKLSEIELSKLTKTIKKTKVSTIFLSNEIKPQLINSIVNQTQVRNSERQIITDNLPLDSEVDTYQKMMVANTRTIVEGLGGTYLIFHASGFKN